MSLKVSTKGFLALGGSLFEFEFVVVDVVGIVGFTSDFGCSVILLSASNTFPSKSFKLLPI
jgi:hypothetical protein